MANGKPVDIGKRPDRLNESLMFENIEWINSGEDETQFLQSYIGKRDYISYGKGKRGQQVLVETHRANPGVLVFTEYEVALAASLMSCKHAVVVEPHVKGTFSGENKRWPWDYWVEVVRELQDHEKRVIQISAPETKTLPDVDFRISESEVRVALACLTWAEMLITTDGLLHHAAAAMGVPAVVIWGSRTDPRILGYPDHVNLSTGPPYCGMLKECKHCQKAMRAITPASVLYEALK